MKILDYAINTALICLQRGYLKSVYFGYLGTASANHPRRKEMMHQWYCLAVPHHNLRELDFLEPSVFLRKISV